MPARSAQRAAPAPEPSTLVAAVAAAPPARSEPADATRVAAAAVIASEPAASRPATDAVDKGPASTTTVAVTLPAADARPAPLAQGLVGAAAPSDAQLRDGVRLIREFSEAYRSGEVQRVVVLFKPNARTPAGNLLDLHSAYQSLFAQSSRRSLEFLQIDWQPTEQGLVGTGRYEWAMRPRNGSRVRAAGGQFRIIIEFDGGRPLIAQFEQQDVG
jgi:hypothetical protein